MSVHSHRYMHLDVCLLRKSLSFAQAIYCADTFVIVIATKFKCVHKILKKKAHDLHELIWSFQYLYKNRKCDCDRGSLLTGKDKNGLHV